MDKFRETVLAMKYLDAGTHENAAKLAGRGIVLPRDLIMLMMYGRLWTLGTETHGWLYSMATLNDVSILLDAFSQLPGAILFRNDDFWDALPPGTVGQILIVDNDGRPAWIDPESPGSGYFSGMTYVGNTIAQSTTAFATKGMIIRPREAITVERVGVGMTGLGTPKTIGVEIAHLASYSLTAAADEIVAPLTAGTTSKATVDLMDIELDAPVILEPGEPYVIAAAILTGIGTTVLNLFGPTAGNGRFQPNAPVDMLDSSVQYNTIGIALAQVATSSTTTQVYVWPNGHATL